MHTEDGPPLPLGKQLRRRKQSKVFRFIHSKSQILHLFAPNKKLITVLHRCYFAAFTIPRNKPIPNVHP